MSILIIVKSILDTIFAGFSALLDLASYREDRKQSRLSEKAQLTNPLEILRVTHKYEGIYDEGTLIDFNQDVGLGYYVDKDLIAYTNPSLILDIVSLEASEWIKIEPYLLIRLLHKVETPDSVNIYLNTEEGKGGGDAPDYFLAILSPNQKDVFQVPQMHEDLCFYLSGNTCAPQNVQIQDQYFNLEPGEREVFIVEFVLHPGYYYEFQIGIPFVYKGRSHIKWVDDPLKASSPRQYKPWTVKGVSDWGEYPDDYLSSGFVRLPEIPHRANKYHEKVGNFRRAMNSTISSKPHLTLKESPISVLRTDSEKILGRL